MDGGIVKLHALADTDGAGAQNDDLFPVRHHRFVLRFIGGVKIRDIAVKFHRAGIDHPVTGADVLLPAEGVDFPHTDTPEFCDGFIGKPALFRFKQGTAVHEVLFQIPLHCHDISQFTEEEGVNGALCGDLLHRRAQPKKLGNGIDPVIGADGNIAQQFFSVPVIEFIHMQMEHTDLQTADAL